MDQWVRSSRCADKWCVEVKTGDGDTVLVRDGKDPAGPVLSFTSAEWDAFIQGARAGEFG